MNNITIDKTLAGLIIGPLVSFLVAKGYFAPDNAPVIVEYADQVIGGAIALFTIIGFFTHHTEVVKHQNLMIENAMNAGTPETTTNTTTVITPPAQPAV